VDIVLNGVDCDGDDDRLIGARLEAGGVCFQHVHSDTLNVVDATYWAAESAHPGNAAAADGGRPNPIKLFAEQGSTTLLYPAHHPISRWDDSRRHLQVVGRLGDTVDFLSLSASLQTQSLAERVGALAVNGSTSHGFEVCGSVGESGNNPLLGHKYKMSTSGQTDATFSDADRSMYPPAAKTAVWTTVALTSNDQLRQRVAWALSQIVVASHVGFSLNHLVDAWAAFHDIFIRHAFGNYRDIIKEVSFSPVMGGYLTFLNNEAYGASGSYPDENYAREVMQLFTLGLFEVHANGTHVRHPTTGAVLETYTNDDIVSFARLWTGFRQEATRGNIESYASRNTQDAMQANGRWRDRFPKTKLRSGFIGDDVPLCQDLPRGHFLRPGATWIYTGAQSIEGSTIDAEEANKGGERGRFEPRPASSALYAALCAPSADTGGCTFPGTVKLDAILPCDSVECDMDTVFSAKVVDTVSGLHRYYRYSQLPCVDLTFYDGVATSQDTTRRQCANPLLPQATVVCCNEDDSTRVQREYGDYCKFGNEHVTMATAVARCAEASLSICTNTHKSGWSSSCAEGSHQWMQLDACTPQAQVYPSGDIGFVDPVTESYDEVLVSSGSTFAVRWTDDSYPTAVGGVCPASCEAVVVASAGVTCLCNVTINTGPAFATLDDLPTTAAALRESLHIGAVPLDTFDEGTFTRCTDPLCTALAEDEDVIVWLATASGGVLDDRSVLSVPHRWPSLAPLLLLNKQSTVSVEGGFTFRNPPNFIPLGGSFFTPHRAWLTKAVWNDRVYHEVDAAIDHLVQHEACGPFVGYRLIQRMVTSNPSPRYMESVSTAFQTGKYGSFGSGVYGDLAATVAAILLDQEARTPAVEVDPRHGGLREPLLRILQMMRSMEYQSKEGVEIVMSGLADSIGMEVFAAPSVFGYYLPEHRPLGPIADAGLVSPEAELATAPLMVAFLNGISSLIDTGLNECNGGWGPRNRSDYSCHIRSRAMDFANGALTYQPAEGDSATPESIVDGISLLLTASRLSSHTRTTMIAEVDAVLSAEGVDEAVKRAQLLVAIAPEYQATNAHLVRADEIRSPPVPIAPQGRPYKAIVVFQLAGGADSFNMFVPYDGCSGKDLHAEYLSVRGAAGMAKGDLLPIDTPGQPCSRFGLHSAMPNLARMYADGDAAVLANMGVIIEPIVAADVRNRTTTKRIPSALFSHNGMQRHLASLDPQNGAAKGVLGRMTESLTQQVDPPYRAGVYSMAGSRKIVESSIAPTFVSRYHGVPRYSMYGELIGAMDEMIQVKSQSVFAETYSDLLASTLAQSESLGALLDETTPATPMDARSALAQIAKVIKVRETLEAERDVFIMSHNDFDSHFDLDHTERFGSVDQVLADFETEMKAQGVWDDVVLLTVSDFGRTLTVNGGGTDHAWGGNYFVIGGAIKGGVVHGQYPSGLTEDADYILGRGRVVPTLGYESVWNGLAEWFGVPAEDLERVLPNVGNFPESLLLSEADLFKQATT